jgi:hypothetical protein
VIKPTTKSRRLLHYETVVVKLLFIKMGPCKLNGGIYIAGEAMLSNLLGICYSCILHYIHTVVKASYQASMQQNELRQSNSFSSFILFNGDTEATVLL